MASEPETHVERRLAAIFAADAADYSRLMRADETRTLSLLTGCRGIIDRQIALHGGRIANTAGDSVLAEFPSAVNAVECAIAVQEELSLAGELELEQHRLQFRIGVHVGDIIIRGGDLFGDGVNIAARLQALAEPGAICISAAAHDYVTTLLRLPFTDLGPQHVKNIEEPIRAYSLSPRAEHQLAPASDATRAKASSVKPSIAVLPFTNMSGDSEQEYFADGIVEDIITALYRVKWLFVIARNSSFIYKGRAVDVKRVGRELGVRYILEGSVRRAGNRVRITGQLVDAATGYHIWADRFESGMEDIFRLQDQIAQSVVGAVEPSVRSVEVERARAKPTGKLDAYDLYLRARPLHFSNDREKLAEAQRLLAQAIAIDPAYSVAKAFSALTTVIQTNQGWANETERERAIRLAWEAASEDRDDPVTLRCAGHALSYLAHQHEVAIELLDRALVLNPNSAEVHHSAGWVRDFMGDGAKAEDHFNRCIRLSPCDPESGHTLMGLAFAQLITERPEQALRYSRQAMAAMPSSLSPLRAQIIALVQLGKREEARSVGRRLLALRPGFRISDFAKVMPFGDSPFVEQYLGALKIAGLPE
jgi:adenylate cyclase